MRGNPRQTGHQVERGRWALQFPELDEVTQVLDVRLPRKCLSPIGKNTHLKRPGKSAARDDVAFDRLGPEFLANAAGRFERALRTDQQEVVRPGAQT